MKNLISEDILLSLGFEREDVSAEEGGDNPFHYFVFNLKNERAILITNSNDECKNGGYCVEFFNKENAGGIVDADILTKLVEVLNNLV